MAKGKYGDMPYEGKKKSDDELMLEELEGLDMPEEEGEGEPMPEGDLSQFSDEELMAELERRKGGEEDEEEELDMEEME